jgi:polyisoprenoid-binding protein YceI
MTMTSTNPHSVGTWQIDPAHSSVGFAVRHMMLSQIRGQFTLAAGTIRTGQGPHESSVVATLDVASLDTGDANRDTHVKSADFLDVATYPTIEFASIGTRKHNDGLHVDGELTVHGITRPVTLDVQPAGAVTDPDGNTRTGFDATTTLSRAEFGLTWNATLEAGGVVIGDAVTVDISVEAVRQA